MNCRSDQIAELPSRSRIPVRIRFTVALVLLIVISLVFPARLPASDPAARQGPAAEKSGTVQTGESAALYQVPPPPLSDYFPCSMCHDELELNRERRELTEEHTEIRLEHDQEHRWCLDCHNPDNRDMLRLASGELVEFTESYRLCGQCHGPKYRDWRAGVHGKRTGSWRGEKQYLLCVHCHDPHTPRYKPIEPLPPPVRPEKLR